MKATYLFVFLALFVAVALSDFQELEVEVTFRPEDCTVKSKNGDILSMHYTGTLENGKQFDSSRGRGPFEFPLGQGRVIKGWDKGLVGMCVGEKRTLRIPSSLGYGARGAGASIPPNAGLIFETELLAIKGK